MRGRDADDLSEVCRVSALVDRQSPTINIEKIRGLFAELHGTEAQIQEMGRALQHRSVRSWSRNELESELVVLDFYKLKRPPN